MRCHDYTEYVMGTNAQETIKDLNVLIMYKSLKLL